MNTTTTASSKKLILSPRELSDVGLILNGAFAPLNGFLGRADYECVVEGMRLAGGGVWSIPVTLSTKAQNRPALDSTVAIVDQNGILHARLDVEEIYSYDKAREANRVYGTEDAAHPGVAVMYAQGEFLIGGRLHAAEETLTDPAGLALTPEQTRAEFKRRGWKTVVGFQTRNPVHRAHEYIQKCALEIVDGLLLHPLVGETKSDDIPAEVRIRCYQVLLEKYYPADRVLLATLPAAMRYAGPREAVFHALIRKNHGCTHFIVGRDHAGVGSYYGTYAAQELIDTFSVAELGITALKYENAFFCKTCDAMTSHKTCPHPVEAHLYLSGTAVRDMLRAGKIPPVQFSRPEVAQVLVEAMR
jgi:sulfate adenylyltransferase